MNNIWFYFSTEFSELNHKSGMYCRIIEQYMPPEVDPFTILFKVVFEDGEEHSAWPDELDLAGMGDLSQVKETIAQFKEEFA